MNMKNGKVQGQLVERRFDSLAFGMIGLQIALVLLAFWLGYLTACLVPIFNLLGD